MAPISRGAECQYGTALDSGRVAGEREFPGLAAAAAAAAALPVFYCTFDPGALQLSTTPHPCHFKPITFVPWTGCLSTPSIPAQTPQRFARFGAARRVVHTRAEIPGRAWR